MKRITIVIPTRNRLGKLKRTLHSIPELDYVDISIICDGDENTFSKLSTYDRKITSVLVHHQRGAVHCRNLITKSVEDGVLYATDDVVFQEGSIQHAFKCFNKNFPDDDGVVGFVQEGNQFNPTGVALVGQKFLQRYPGKKLFYPGYFHFACQEVYDLCQKLKGKFIQDTKAGVFHYHPVNFNGEMDQTHYDARVRKKEDHDLIRERKEKGLIWGFDCD